MCRLFGLNRTQLAAAMLSVRNQPADLQRRTPTMSSATMAHRKSRRFAQMSRGHLAVVHNLALQYFELILQQTHSDKNKA